MGGEANEIYIIAILLVCLVCGGNKNKGKVLLPILRKYNLLFSLGTFMELSAVYLEQHTAKKQSVMLC